jgi:hypothetical protein
MYIYKKTFFQLHIIIYDVNLQIPPKLGHLYFPR